MDEYSSRIGNLKPGHQFTWSLSNADFPRLVGIDWGARWDGGQHPIAGMDDWICGILLLVSKLQFLTFWQCLYYSGWRCGRTCSDRDKPPPEGEDPSEEHAKMDLHRDHHPADHHTHRRPLTETVELGEVEEYSERSSMPRQYRIYHNMMFVA